MARLTAVAKKEERDATTLFLKCGSWPWDSHLQVQPCNLETTGVPGLSRARLAGVNERDVWSCLELRRPDFNATQRKPAPTYFYHQAYLHHESFPLVLPSIPPTVVICNLTCLRVSSLRACQISERDTTEDVTMDTLVAKYSRPAYAQNEGLNEQDELDFGDGVPGPSLKFAMPPVAQVSLHCAYPGNLPSPTTHGSN